MSRALSALALVLSLSSLLATIWIVLPAPAYQVWLLSVVVSEWSLAFGALGACGLLCSLLARARGGRWWLAATAGALALCLALYPWVSARRAARAHGVSLSLRQYVLGGARADTSNATEDAAGRVTTYTFAVVEGRALQLDAYPPLGAGAAAGAGVIVVHGGSWRAGARSDFPRWNRWLARQGFAVFDVDYRLAPQPNWQTATGDVKCAVLWVKRHAAELHVAPDRLALLGRSAGGHLALLAAYTPDDAALPASCGAAEGGDAVPPAYDASVRAVVSFYGPTDLLWAYEHPANQRVIDGPATISRFLGGAPDSTAEVQTRFQLASPVAHVGGLTPPTLLIHGGHDQLVRCENMDLLGQRLTAVGVPYRRVLIGYAQHGFDYNFNGWGAQVVRPVLLDFLRASTTQR